MLFSLSDIAIAIVTRLLTLWAVGAVVLRIIPNIQTFFDAIELGKKVLNFIGEAPEWINYSENLDQIVAYLNAVMQNLIAIEEDVQQEVKLVEFQNNARRRREVDNWLGNVARRNQEAGDLVNEVERTGSVSRFLYRAWLGSCVENKMKELRVLIDQRLAFQGNLAINAQRVGRERLVTSALLGQVAAQRVEEIRRNLTRINVTILGLEGDQGMGKSITMMHIYNLIVDNPSLFDCAYYVSVQEDDGVYQLQSAIGRELGLRGLEDEDDVRRRAARIYRALMSSRRFVLILDGLMSSFELNDVGIPLGEGGGKLVVVARCGSRRVCQRMLCRPIMRVDALPFGDARELFMHTLRPSSDLSPEIEGICVEIIRGCNGVPGRIIEVAQSLRSVDDVFSWRERLMEM